MRKALRILAVALSLTLVVSVAQAAVKAGSACSKLGSTSTVSGKKYTCIKSGKKLVWNKGVVVVKPTPVATATPTPTPTPTPTATPTATPTPTSAPFVEGGECEKMGLQGKDSRGLLECRKIAGNKLSYIRINNDFSPVVNPVSPEPITTCQLPDKRPNVTEWAPAIAYPARPMNVNGSNWKATGTYKVAVVGIDFSDSQGEGSPATVWNNDLKLVTEWLKWYTNDNVRYDFVTHSKWLRAPKTSDRYDALNHSVDTPGLAQAGGLTNDEIAADYILAIEEAIDLRNVDAIWVYLPPDITKIVGQWVNKQVSVQTKKYGVVHSLIVANGADTYQSKRINWGYFLHELLHVHGIKGHSPKLGLNDTLSRLGQMSTAAGWTNALLPWDAIVAGWQKPNDVYCVEKARLTTVDITLAPLEREQLGTRAVMVKLSDHQILMVESHHQGKWGLGAGPGFYGVMVSFIDTSIETTWDAPAFLKNQTSTGLYLKVDGASHGKHEPIGTVLKVNGQIYHGVGVVNGIGIAGDYEGWDLNYLMYLGESITNSGIKVSLIKSGDNDTVRIEKVA